MKKAALSLILTILSMSVFANGRVVCKSIPYETISIIAEFDQHGHADVQFSELKDGPGSWRQNFEGSVEAYQIGFNESLSISILFDGPSGQVSALRADSTAPFTGTLSTPYHRNDIEVKCELEYM